MQVPTRGGIDSYQPAIDLLAAWSTPRGVAPEVLHNESGAVVGLALTVEGAGPGPTWVFDACLDTAGFGDEDAWTHGPTSAVVEDGWLYGRGSADSKAAVAILCHLAVRLAAAAGQLHGRLVVLLDLDEHTGVFGGAKVFFAKERNVAAVMIAYPGVDHLVTGGRGLHRLKLDVFGQSAHSGSSKSSPNAIVKAAEIITELSKVNLPAADRSSNFPLPGKITVTAVTGGEGFSVNPDRCTLNVDVRTTPAFDGGLADAVANEIISHIDARWPDTAATVTEVVSSWQPYALPPESPLPAALLPSARLFGLHPVPKVAGPSNIGNYLAGLGIPATAGFGVDYVGLHATNERIRIESIPAVQATYHATALQLLGVSVAPSPTHGWLCALRLSRSFSETANFSAHRCGSVDGSGCNRLLGSQGE